MIWLSRTTEVEEERVDEAGEALDEAEDLDSQVGEKEDILASAVEELDRKEKKKEKDAFKSEIDSQKDDWFDIIAEYKNKKNTMDAMKVVRLDRVVMEVERYKAEEWRYGSSGVPPFKYFAGMEERKRILLSDNDVRGAMRELLSVIKQLGEKRARARDALLNEASQSPSSARRGTPEIVKVDTVSELVVDSHRSTVRHTIPASISSTRHSVVFQDIGNAPMEIRFTGVLTGQGRTSEEKRQDMMRKVDTMTSFLRSGDPLYFSSSLTNRSGLATRVILSEFSVVESLEMIDGVRFTCTLFECNPEEGEEGVETHETSHWRRLVALSTATKYVDSFYAEGDLKPEAEDTLANMIIQGVRIKRRM